MKYEAAPFGDVVIAVCGIVSRVMTLGFMILMGFMKGYQVFVGYHYGAKNYERVHLATRKVLVWSNATKFMGLGKGKEREWISLGRQGFFFIPAIYVLIAYFGLNGLILAQENEKV